MAKRKPKHSTEPLDIPQVPFDDALKHLLGAPPQHRVKKKRRAQKSKAS